MIGTVISHYRIVEKLGEGGMGVVYRAEDLRLGRSVAIKALPPDFGRDPDRRERFRREARAAATLNHPGIASVFELEEIGDDLYIVFELVQGVTLRKAIGTGPLDLDTVLALACGLAVEVHRVEPWLRRADALFMVLLLALAAVVAASHTAAGAVLAGLAVGGLVIQVIVEPTIARSAFPGASIGPSDSVRRDSAASAG